MRMLVAACVAGAVWCVGASPVIPEESIRLDRVGAGTTYQISYRLEGGPAVVTVSLFTNDVQVLHVTGLRGDVFVPCESGDRAILWRSSKSLPCQRIPNKGFKVRLTAWPLDNLPDYQVTDLAAPWQTRWYASLDELPEGGLTNRIYRTEKLLMRKIAARGVPFRMGCGDEYPFRASRQVKDGLRTITLSDDYYIGVYELTQGQYVNGVQRSNPSKFRADNAEWTTWVAEDEHDRCDERPLENRSYNAFHGSGDEVGADSDLAILRANTRIAFDLPTEAQWEFAARAGVTTPWADGVATQADASLKKFGGFGYMQPYDYGTAADGTARNHWPFTLPVGQFQPNRWGLYDVHANVNEACRDKMNDEAGWMDEVVYPVCAGVDPQGVPEMKNWDRVARGGSYEQSAGGDSYLGRRYSYFPHQDNSSIGFRLICPARIGSTAGKSRKELFTYVVPEGEDVFVTAEVTKGGVSVQAQATFAFAGEVGRRVAPGEYKFYWFPSEEWSGDGEIAMKIRRWPLSTPPSCLVTDLSLGMANHAFYSSVDALPGGLADVRYRTTHLVMSHIPAADVVWRMGYDTTVGATSDRRVKSAHHYVKLTSDFYLGVYPVTQAQYQRVTGTNPSDWKDDAVAPSRPVNKVSYQTLRGTNKSWPQDGHSVDDGSVLALFRARTGLSLDLPTEAQWEFAARGENNPNANCTGLTYAGRAGRDAQGRLLSDYAYFTSDWGNPLKSLRAVGQGFPTAWNLYDMQGNAWDMCLDWLNDAEGWYCTDYAATFTSETEPLVDPAGCAAPDAAHAGRRVVRGGSIYQGSDNIDIPFRHSECTQSEVRAAVSFRLACPCPSNLP